MNSSNSLINSMVRKNLNLEQELANQKSSFILSRKYLHNFRKVLKDIIKLKHLYNI